MVDPDHLAAIHLHLQISKLCREGRREEVENNASAKCQWNLPVLNCFRTGGEMTNGNPGMAVSSTVQTVPIWPMCINKAVLV